jgi:hypothetical protein
MRKELKDSAMIPELKDSAHPIRSIFGTAHAKTEMEVP